MTLLVETQSSDVFIVFMIFRSPLVHYLIIVVILCVKPYSVSKVKVYTKGEQLVYHKYTNPARCIS